MKISSQVRIFPNLIGGLDLADVALLLNQIPQPAFLINAAADQILLANSKALQLTQWTNEQLQNASLRSILDGLPPTLNIDPASTTPCQVLTTNGKILQGSAQLHLLPKRSQWSLLVFTPSDSIASSSSQQTGHETLWQAFQWANFLLFENSLADFLNHTLENLMAISGCENGYLYTALANQTTLTCNTSREETSVFPNQLSVEALLEIASPIIWMESSPPKTYLAQLAKERGQGFLVALPLGETNARVGLILLSARQVPPCPLQLEQWENLSHYLSTLLQLFYQTRHLEKELSIQSRENSIHRQLLNSIQEGVILLNPDQRVLFMNAAAETILGYTCAEALHQTIQTFLISERDLCGTIHNTLQGTVRSQIRSLRLYRRSGQSFLADLQLIPLKIDQKVNGIAILIQDRTEQETLLKQSMRMEQRAALGEFTTLFAHEARNPINNITANLQWMSMNLPAEDPNQTTIQRIQQNCERLNDLMDTILSYNRINEMEMELIDLKSIMKKVLDRQSIHLQQSNILLNYEAAEKIPLIKGNRRALERVFANLIDNAIQVMKENGGNLTVKLFPSPLNEDRQEWLEISIADSGPGIAEEYKEKLFKESFTTKTNGTGIGLIISHKIIQAHKGTIDYQSIPGGTVFVVRLPLATTPEPSTSA